MPTTNTIIFNTLTLLQFVVTIAPLLWAATVGCLAEKLSECDRHIGGPVVVAVTHAKMGASHSSGARLAVGTLLFAQPLPGYPTR
jgi:hypothetical protein